MDQYIERRGFDADLSGLRDEWDELLLRSSRPTVYSTYDYVCIAHRHFRKDEDAFVLLLRDASDGRLMAIFPLSIWSEKSLGIGVRTVRHAIPPQYSDVDKPYPVIDRDHEATCWKRFRDYFYKEFRGWDIMVFDEIIDRSNLNTGLLQLFHLPFHWAKAKPGPTSPIVRLDGSAEDFLAAHPNLRAKSRRLERRIGDRFSYVVTGDPADVERCLNEYAAIELAGWKAGTGITREKATAFYQELLPKLAGKGLLYFGMMYDGDTVISAEISYVFLERVYFALGTYNPDYTKLSPGTVSSGRFIQFFCGKGYVEGDFLAGYAHYVEPWSSHVEKTVNITIRRMGWKNGCLAVRHLLRKRGRNA